MLASVRKKWFPQFGMSACQFIAPLSPWTLEWVHAIARRYRLNGLRLLAQAGSA